MRARQKKALSSEKKQKKPKLPNATVEEAVQKRISPTDHSSIIPGIDMNDLKHQLDLLKYALDYSEAIVDTVRLPLVVLNKKLQVLTANRAFYETFDLSPEVTENQSIYKLNSGAWNIPKLKILLGQILPANTHFYNYEVEITIPQKGLRTIVLNARRTYRQVNNTEAILLAFEDITDRKQLERHKDDFIGIVSHELKTPLTAIKAYSQVLEKYLKDNNDVKGILYLSKMLNQTAKLVQLTSSFQNVYRIQSGKLVLHKSRFTLEDLIENIVSEFKNTTKTHAIEYLSSSKTTIYADKVRLTQVLVNLISNAVKYSPQSDKVVVKSFRDGTNITVSVQDFGAGIPKEEQEKIFDRFYRVQSKNEKGISGLGLGLYISYEIITQHKGKLWVDSETSNGSVFSFSLPDK